MRIKCPKTLHDDKVSIFLEQVWQAQNHDELEIDFSTLDFAFPYATMLVAENLKALFSYRHERSLKVLPIYPVKRNDAVHYLSHVGFFQYVGLDFGKEPSEAPGSNTYIPITVITRSGLTGTHPGTRIQESIKSKSEELSKLLFKEINELPHVIMLSYCLREIIRNVFEHAEADTCVVFGQRLAKGQTEIAVTDMGCGIHSSLSKRYKLNTVLDALQSAIKPGVSSATTTVVTDDPWENSGFGLYVLSQLGNAYGSFVITSGNHSLKLKSGKESFSSLPFSGTAIKLSVQDKHAEYFPNFHKQVVDRGTQCAVAMDIHQGQHLSQMLS